MRTPGAVNTTLRVLAVTGSNVDAVAGALPHVAHQYASIPPQLPADGGTITIAFAPTTPTVVVDQTRNAVGALPGSVVSEGRQTWGAVTLRSPLSGAAPYVAAVGRDTTAAASPTAVAALNRAVPGGWQLAVDTGTGDLLLYVQARTALTPSMVDQLKAVLGAEAGAPPQVVRVVAGVPQLDAETG